MQGYLAEYGLVVAKGASNVAALVEHAQASGSGVPTAALDILVKMLAMLEEQIKQLDIEIAREPDKRELLDGL